VVTTEDAPKRVRSDAAAPAAAEERARTSAIERVGLVGFAVLAYVPLLLTDVGKIDADSKAYFYLNPGRLLAGAASLWDPSVGMGSVAYQMLGFLFPVGPFYWFTEQVLDVPAWIAQRIWLGTLIFAAGLGMRYLLRTLGLRGPGVAVGMVAFAFSPYAIQFSSSQSVLLPPWAGLPWMVAFVVLALRDGGWKYPAVFAITVQLTGSVNASTLVLALIAPALWIPYAVVLAREVDWRRALTVVWRTTLLVVLTSLWWASALLVESAYGRNILRFTEQPSTTAATLNPLEVLRGLGYWIFYYRDANEPLRAAATTFMRNPAVLFGSILIVALALLAATSVRWTYRSYFVLLVVIGVALGVGAGGSGGSSPFGAAFKLFSSGSTAGFALRNSARAVPLIALGIAALLAAGVSALYRHLTETARPRAGVVVVVSVLVLCIVNAPGVWARSYYDTALEWRSVPTYWRDAASSLDRASHDTRVLALPGSPFGRYTWGATQDPVEPGLMERPFATIQQIPEGSDATANLLSAVDVPLQAGELDPNALASVARLMGVGDVLLNMDLQSSRYRLVPSPQLWNTFTVRQPRGLGTPREYGPTNLNPTGIEPGSIGRPPLATPPRLAVFPVESPLNIVRTKSDADPLVVDGDGQGLVSMAAAGLLDARRLVLYSAALGRTKLQDLPSGAALVVTDSNRRRPFWATSLTNSYGPTEQAGENPLERSGYDQRLDVFPDASSDAQTVAVLSGVKSVQATQGAAAFNAIDTRPSLVLDGNVYTGWLIGAGARPGSERLRIELEKPITADQLNLVQRLSDATVGRWITQVTLRFDGGNAVRQDLDLSSRSEMGQTLRFPKRTFSTLEIRIERLHTSPGAPADDPVGFAEVRLAGDDAYATPLRVQETVRLPSDLLRSLGPESLDHPLAIVVSRDPMDDTALNRQIWLPTARSFTIGGTARLGPAASDTDLDALLGIPDASEGGVTATSDGRYRDTVTRASSAIDGDPVTAWTTPLGKPTGSVHLTLPRNVTVDHLDLVLVDDGRHSLPTKLQIDSDTDERRVIDLTAFPHHDEGNGTVSVPVTVDAMRGRRFDFTITDVEPNVTTVLDPSGTVLPSGIAELGIPGVVRGAMGEQVSDRCLDDLLTIDGRPFPVRLTGSTIDALQAQPLALEPCGDGDITLSAGMHEISAAESPSSPSGADVQSLLLSSAAGGEAAPQSAVATEESTPRASPAVRVVQQSRTSMTLEADPASEPYWLVLGQSINRGWVAEADGRDLGRPVLVDGFANGWRIEPRDGEATTITLQWEPQRGVRLALIVSALAMLACVGIVIAGWFVRRRRRVAPPEHLARPARWNNPVILTALPYRRRAVIATVVTTAILGSILVRPWVGPILALFAYVAIRDSRWRAALRLAPGCILLATALWMTIAQVVRDYPANFQWPQSFSSVTVPVWTAVVLLAVDSLIACLWHTDDDAGAGARQPSSGLSPGTDG
jgi:arabinofuranan 3-O-arabinosyltransferase